MQQGGHAARRASGEAAAAEGHPAAHALPPGLLEPATEERLRRALSGLDERRKLALGDLEPGDVGVLEVVVRQVHPIRPFERKRGGIGLLGKVTLADTTGEATLLLWDDETRLVQDGTFEPGLRLRIQGATAVAARRGGTELSLGAAVVTPLRESAVLRDLAGTLLSVGVTRVVGSPPRERFQADVVLETTGGRTSVLAEGEVVKSLRSILPGARIVLGGVSAHPILEDWWIAGSGTSLRRQAN